MNDWHSFRKLGHICHSDVDVPTLGWDAGRVKPPLIHDEAKPLFHRFVALVANWQSRPVIFVYLFNVMVVPRGDISFKIG
jgi:hypothetical protein